MMALAVRQNELLAQLRELLLLPSPAPVAEVESAGGGGPLGTGGPILCDGTTTRRRRRRGSKRCRNDEKIVVNGQHDDREAEPAADAQAQPLLRSCKTRTSSRRKKPQQETMKSLVTSVPDFDGYQWRKYGQKQIEAAMYPRSYYRCTRSAEQGCPAKRTVQRNDDDGEDGGASAPKYTVVYMEEHTCTANDSLEAPVILETTALIPSDTSNSIVAPATTSSAAGSSSTTTTTTTVVVESPAISEDITWSSGGGGDYYVDDYHHCRPWFAVDDCSWAPASSSSSSSLQEFTGPIRSPVHMPAVDGWTTIDHQFLLQLADDPDVCHFSF